MSRYSSRFHNPVKLSFLPTCIRLLPYVCGVSTTIYIYLSQDQAKKKEAVNELD